jgi:hypothetical protein
MQRMVQQLKKAATKVHPQCEVEISEMGVVEVMLPEDCGLLWAATEGTMLVASEDMFGSLREAVRATLDDIRLGVYAGKM